MTKTSREDLAEEVQSELVTYLETGKPINTTSLTRALDFSGLSITDFGRLKRIRFVLSQPVQKFLKKLDRRVRRIRTASEVETQRSQGELRGAIDWGQTIRQRYSENPTDRSLFVARTPYTEYQIPENTLLKVLLSIIYQTATDDIAGIDKQWRYDRWSDADREDFERLYRTNVHIDRIEGDPDTRLRSQHLNAARRSRQPLYYRAYELYRCYQRLLDNEFSDADVRDLLYETLIVPDTPTLFELSCIFRLLNRLGEDFPLTLHPIDDTHEALARLENDAWQLDVFHDATGPLRLVESLPPEPADEYLQRYERVVDGLQAIMDIGSRPALYRGRPDIVIKASRKSDDGLELAHILVGEVKYTDSKQTLSRGVRQLQEYLTYARIEEPPWETEVAEPYLSDSTSVSSSGIILTASVREREPYRNTIHLNRDSLSSVDQSVIEDLIMPPG